MKRNNLFKTICVLSLTLLLPIVSSCGNNSSSSSNPATSDVSSDTTSDLSSETTSEEGTSSLKDKYNCISIPEAIQIANQAGQSGTSERYYIHGYVKVISNPQYGEMTIVDEDGNELYVYGTYSSDGSLKFLELDSRPDEADEVILHCILSTYDGNPQIKNARLIEFTSLEEPAPEIDLSQYSEAKLDVARSANDGTLLKVTGVVSRITYSEGMVPNGFYLVDDTSSIFIHRQETAVKVAIGNTVTLVGEKDYWILDKEQSTAALFNYKGCNQLTNVTLLENDKGDTEYNKSWITQSTVKEIMDTDFSVDNTTKIYKVNALVKKVEGSGFTNYYFNDIDGYTGSYAYSQCSGADYSWLDEFDGKICTVYLTAHNAKAANGTCFYRFVPITVIDEGYTFDIKNAPQYAIDYVVSDQFDSEYKNDPALELESTVSSELLNFEGVTLSYSTSNNDVRYFVEEGDKLIMHTNEVEEDTTVTITVKASLGSNSVYNTYSIIIRKQVKVEGISVKEAIESADGSEVQVKGIVVASIVNQTGFYIADETGIIAVRTSVGTTDKQVKPGDLVSVIGTKTHVRPSSGKCVGQIAIDNASLVANGYGEHEIPTNSFNYDETLTSLKDFDALEDHTTQVYVVQAKIEFVETPYYTSMKLIDPETNTEFGLYMKSAGQYSFLNQFSGKTVTMEIVLCNWNEKNYYRGCVLSVTCEGVTVYNTLNFEE